MATVGIMGPFVRQERLAPGQSIWFDPGESDGFKSCALSITATPLEGEGGAIHVMKVENVNITGVIRHDGDIVNETFFAGCSVVNNGQTTITRWQVLVGVIVP